MPRVSIVLPFHNARRYLRGAIESVTADRELDSELLLIDDGSTDGGASIAAAAASRDARIRLIRTGHRGVVEGLNRGIAEAEAPLVARMDADDIAHPCRVARQCALLAQRPEIDLVSCLVRPLCDGAGLGEGTRRYLDWLNASIGPTQIRRDLFVESPLPHPTVVFRKKTVEALGGYRDYDGPEDYDLWLRMASAGCRFAKIPEVLLEWRIHPRSLSRTDRRYRTRAFYRRKFDHVVGELRNGGLGGGRRLRLWGAGANGRRLGACLRRAGYRIEAFVDIDPRKVGTVRGGVKVLSAEVVGRDDEGCHYLCVVGSWGAREAIRHALGSAGKAEGEDFTIL
jgi:glycosyltransferase involved in cell wall biosynthesis